MESCESEVIIQEYLDYISAKDFPCVAARAAQANMQVQCIVADHMLCPKDDKAILEFIYSFIDHYRLSDNMFHSVAILFKGPSVTNEETFDSMMWQRLQSLSNLDALRYGYDKRVSANPESPEFSFSLKEEAFFIIGVHPYSNRPARRFKYPGIAFNPHAQFESLRNAQRYDKLKTIVRKRDVIISGSVNPMLEDFGQSSEVYQYSGRQYDGSWKCPLNIVHGKL